MTVPDLRTARLPPRGLRESDEDAVVDVFAAPEMSEFHILGWQPVPPSRPAGRRRRSAWRVGGVAVIVEPARGGLSLRGDLGIGSRRWERVL